MLIEYVLIVPRHGMEWNGIFVTTLWNNTLNWETFSTRIYNNYDLENLTLSTIIEALNFVGGSSC